MTVCRGSRESAQKSTQVHPTDQAIRRISAPKRRTSHKADRAYFYKHPEEDSYIREFVPGEFGKAELPEIPDCFRYATHVEVTLRVNGDPIGRYRSLMAVCDGVTLKRVML
jgi:hypothetical protein